jgi:hypothetical protein
MTDMTNLFARKSGARQILVGGSAPNPAVGHNVHRALVV